jgi:hypothetical protein
MRMPVARRTRARRTAIKQSKVCRLDSPDRLAVIRSALCGRKVEPAPPRAIGDRDDIH